MTLFEAFAQTQIVVDFFEGISFGHEQADVYYPTVFPTVDFILMATSGLCKIADRVRLDSGIDLETMNGEGRGEYTFRIGVNGFTKSKLDTSVEFTVSNTAFEDEGYVYLIDLSEEEQTIIFKVLDEQCREAAGKSCDELLAEARDEMMRDEK